MKIDFNKESMTIKFDKVPRFLYFNENGEGSGKVFLDGQRIKELQEVNVHAESINDKINFESFKYFIKKYNSDAHSSETIGNYNSSNFATVEVKIMDIEPFKSVISTIKQFIYDDRISSEIRNEYIDIFQKTIESEKI